MKKTKLLTTLLPLTCLAGVITPIITSCNKGKPDEPIVTPDVSFDETQKSKQTATWGTFISDYTAVYTGFKFNKFTKEQASKMTVTIENLTGFDGTATPTITNVGDTTFDVSVYFKSSWERIDHCKATFDLKFTSATNETWTKTITGFSVVFTNNIVTVTRDNETRTKQKIYKSVDSNASVDVVLKTDFEFWVNGAAADQTFIDGLQINVPQTQFNDVTIIPSKVEATGGAIYVVLAIQNFTDATINYKFSFKNNSYGWESETYNFELNLTTDSNDEFEIYNYDDKKWAISACNSCETTITIPEHMVFGEDEIVTKINPYAFHYCANMESITISKNIQEIDTDMGNPFYGCYNLETIKVDTANTKYSSKDATPADCNCIMDKEATKIIAGCKSTTVANSVKTIDVQAFNGCLGLETIDLNNVETIENGAFQGCTNLTTVKATKVDRMYNYAFSWCTSLKDITLGDELTTLYHNVFEYCDSIVELTLPNKIAGVSGDCFVGCKNLAKITVDSDKFTSQPDGTERNGIFEKGTNKLIRGCKNTTMIEGITSIEDYAFAGCEFTGVIIPNSVTKLGKNAFSSCVKLSEVIIPEKATAIGEACFEDCYALKNVTINAPITEIKNGTFKNCYILNPITIPETVETIKYGVFENNYYMEAITIPASVKTICDDSFKNCAYLKSATFKVTTGWTQNIIGKESQAVDPAELADSAKAAYYLINKLPTYGLPMERK